METVVRKKESVVGDKTCLTRESYCGNVDVSVEDVPMMCHQNHNDHRHPPSSLRIGAGGDVNNRREGFPKKISICDRIEEQLQFLGKGTTWLALFLGQILSLLLCLSSFSTMYLTDSFLVHVPNAQNFSFYILLAIIFTTMLAFRPAERNLFPILQTRGWKYAFVALADAEGNFLVVKAYQLTTLMSVQLLDCFTIPTVLSLSWLVLRIRFKVPHILGVFICLLGICCLVWANIEEGKPVGLGKDRFLGDMLCLSGAFLYGISNIAQELVVKNFDPVEFLGMMGLFGSFFSGTQAFLLEYEAVSSLSWSATLPAILLILTYAGAKFVFYVLSTVVMKLSSATAFNLSILSADFYSLIVGIYLCQFKFHALYFLSFVLVMTGGIVFAIKPTEIASHIYKSLTRELTTTLDLELIAASPTSPRSYQRNKWESQGAAEDGRETTTASIFDENSCLFSESNGRNFHESNKFPNQSSNCRVMVVHTKTWDERDFGGGKFANGGNKVDV